MITITKVLFYNWKYIHILALTNSDPFAHGIPYDFVHFLHKAIVSAQRGIICTQATVVLFMIAILSVKAESR